MMKPILSILLFLVFFQPIMAQDQEEILMPLDENTGLITYQEVVNVAGNKDTLFNRCSTWLHTFYANPWEATKVRDQATGLIKIQHQFRVYDTDENGNKIDAGMIIYSLKIEFKQDRYRFTIDNLTLKAVSRYPLENWMDKTRPDYDEKNVSYLKQIDHYFRVELIPSLKEAMLPKEELKEAEW
jgi:hypothetical protein